MPYGEAGRRSVPHPPCTRCSGLWVEGVESLSHLHLVQAGEGSASRRGEKTVNQKTLERPQRSTQIPQGCRWKFATKKDYLRWTSYMPSRDAPSDPPVGRSQRNTEVL